MGKDNRAWRKLVKKLRRSRLRKAAALERDKNHPLGVIVESESESEDEMVVNPDLEHDLAEAEWIRQEEEAQLAFRMKQAEEQAQALAREAKEKQMRTEWEQIKKLEAELREKEELEAKEKSAKQEEEFNSLLDFLSGDIENPPQPFLMPQTEDDREICLYFVRTAACRYFDRCERAHPKPTLSSQILIQNFFSHFSLEQGLRDEFDTDLTLEYEDADMHKEFLEFYEDVLPEFQAVGKVVQFKACCNFAPHLRGNVYIQYDNIREAVQAYRIFNARFYNGRQISVQFVRVPSWRSAICGLFNRRKCTKAKTCNFLHVFRNPTKEFVAADNDWAEWQPPSSNFSTPFCDNNKEKRDQSSREKSNRDSRRQDRHRDRDHDPDYDRNKTRRKEERRREISQRDKKSSDERNRRKRDRSHSHEKSYDRERKRLKEEKSKSLDKIKTHKNEKKHKDKSKKDEKHRKHKEDKTEDVRVKVKDRDQRSRSSRPRSRSKDRHHREKKKRKNSKS